MISIEEIKKINDSIPEIQSARLVFRFITESDLEDIFEYAKNPKITEYLCWDYHKNKQDTLNFISQTNQSYSNSNDLVFGIILKNKQKLIGSIGMHKINHIHSSCELGYVINDKFWNKGYMTESVQTIVKFGFNELKLNRIIARIRLANITSQKVLEKNGFIKEGLLREEMLVKGKYVDHFLFSILEKDFINS